MKVKLDGIWCALGAFVLLAAGVVFCLTLTSHVEIDKNVSFVQAIKDHRLARANVGYLHDGKTIFRRIQACETATNSEPAVAWFKLADAVPATQLNLWQKIKNRCQSFVKELSFDENGAVVFVKDPSAKTLPEGCYVHLGSVRVEVDITVAGTYVYEFPFYMDNTITGVKRSELLAGFRKQLVPVIREVVHGLVKPEESYKVTDIPNGVVMTRVLAKFVFEVKEGADRVRET